MNVTNSIVKHKKSWVYVVLACRLLSYADKVKPKPMSLVLSSRSVDSQQQLRMLGGTTNICDKDTERTIKKFIREQIKDSRHTIEFRRCRRALKSKLKNKEYMKPDSYDSFVQDGEIGACGAVMYAWYKKLENQIAFASECNINSRKKVSKIKQFFRVDNPLLQAQYCFKCLVAAIALEYEEKMYGVERCTDEKNEQIKGIMLYFMVWIKNTVHSHPNACFRYMKEANYSLQKYERYVDVKSLPNSKVDMVDRISCNETFNMIYRFAVKRKLEHIALFANCATMVQGVANSELDRRIHYNFFALSTHQWHQTMIIKRCDENVNKRIRSHVQTVLGKYQKCSKWLTEQSIGFVEYVNSIKFEDLIKKCSGLEQNGCLDAFKVIAISKNALLKGSGGCLVSTNVESETRAQYSSLLFSDTVSFCIRENNTERI